MKRMMQSTTDVLVRKTCGQALKDLIRRKEGQATEATRAVMQRGRRNVSKRTKENGTSGGTRGEASNHGHIAESYSNPDQKKAGYVSWSPPAWLFF